MNHVMPLVSVILPTYNDAVFLSSAIDSVLGQTYKNIELLVVDDDSTDCTADLMLKYRNDKRIQYIKLIHNSGVAIARNTAIEHSTGSFLAFIDSDDVWYDRKLERQLRYMISRQIDISYSYYELSSERMEVFKKIDKLPQRATYEGLLKTNFIPLLTVIAKKSKLNELYFKSIPHEDYGLWLSLLHNDHLNVCAYPYVTAKYRVHRNSVSSNKLKSLTWVWNIYRREENLSFCFSVKCLFFYVVHGFTKHFL